MEEGYMSGNHCLEHGWLGVWLGNLHTPSTGLRHPPLRKVPESDTRRVGSLLTVGFPAISASIPDRSVSVVIVSACKSACTDTSVLVCDVCVCVCKREREGERD